MESRYADLLTSPERAFIDDFRSLGEQAQRLYVRLAMRKGPVFRRDRLDYPEIEDLDAAAAAL
ncbi:MAG: VRR-NUC domain-containing protein, partial [Acidobacteriota bacterium]